MEKIYRKHVKEVLGKTEEVPIINVLSKKSFLKERIPRSINIPFQNDDQFVQDVEKITKSKNQKIIVYSASHECPLSEKAAKALHQAGFSFVMEFEGGMKDWKDSGENYVGA